MPADHHGGDKLHLLVLDAAALHLRRLAAIAAGDELLAARGPSGAARGCLASRRRSPLRMSPLASAEPPAIYCVNHSYISEYVSPSR